MNLPQHIAKHLRDVYFGGNWTTSNMKELLTGITWEQATTQVHGLNTIALLVFHSSYYLPVAIKVLQGGAIEGSDKLSFEMPPITSQPQWEDMQLKTWTDVETLATLVEQLPESKMWEPFTNEKYGDYYRNLQGIVEHTHYHLGQISLIKKIVSEPTQL